MTGVLLLDHTLGSCRDSPKQKNFHQLKSRERPNSTSRLKQNLLYIIQGELSEKLLEISI